ncbi:MAG: hypothetical protein IKR64_09885 [Treponema sp.]|nr:hypothetical protein [Treponema sp.]
MQTQTLENQTSTLESPYKKPLLIQILLGVVFGLLNHGVYFLQSFNPVPLYMDTLFTVTASFFGAVSGVIAGALYHILYLFIYTDVALSSLAWMICSLTIVLIIRLYIKIRKRVEFPDIILLIFLIALIISLEGAIIFTILNAVTAFVEDSQIKFMYALLNSNSFSTFVSALLPRVPVNILDKAICVLLGWYSYRGVQKLFTLSKKA